MDVKKYIFALGLFLPALAFGAPTGKMTVLVLDDLGNPLSGAKVSIGFRIPNPSGGWGSTNDNSRKGFTDSDGKFTASGETVADIGCGAYMDGYYRSGCGISFTSLKGFGPFKRWHPWNPLVTVVLKKQINPIPMYARKIETTIPVRGIPVGFDLKEGDWVVPYGSGLVKDFIFFFDVQGNADEWDGITKISFSNETDGIQDWFLDQENRSMLRMPYAAPQDGYSNKWQRREISRWIEKEASSQITELRNDQNYFFRVRSKKDSDGNLIGGLYGKIHGNIIFTQYGILKFKYYLNPISGDRNVEYDPKNNLARDISNKNLRVLTNIAEP